MFLSILLQLSLILSANAQQGIGADLSSEHCLKCHASSAISGKAGKKIFIDREQFNATSHAAVGCSACHTVQPGHPANSAQLPKVDCGKCHEQTAMDYARSKHANNAVCVDCHDPHTVKSIEGTSAVQMNEACARCHAPESVAQKHAKWLPQTSLHIASLPCVACHTRSENYVITMFVGKRPESSNKASSVPLTWQEFNEHSTRRLAARKLLDQNNDDSVSLDELRRFNRTSDVHGMWLYGVMMPERITHDFQTLTNRLNCTYCHATGPDARQTSFVALPTEKGRFERLPVEKGAILDILYGTPDFYMVGATRSDVLSILAALIIAGGIMFPVVHGTFRILTAGNRKKKGHGHE